KTMSILLNELSAGTRGVKRINQLSSKCANRSRLSGFFIPTSANAQHFLSLGVHRRRFPLQSAPEIFPRSGDIMKVAKDLVVSLAYQVRTEDGVLVDESPVSAPLDYLHGHGSLISGLENA